MHSWWNMWPQGNPTTFSPFASISVHMVQLPHVSPAREPFLQAPVALEGRQLALCPRVKTSPPAEAPADEQDGRHLLLLIVIAPAKLPYQSPQLRGPVRVRVQSEELAQALEYDYSAGSAVGLRWRLRLYLWLRLRTRSGSRCGNWDWSWDGNGGLSRYRVRLRGRLDASLGCGGMSGSHVCLRGVELLNIIYR